MNPDIKGVWIGPSWMVRSDIKALERSLVPGERVLAGVACKHSGGTGSLAVTDRRVCLIASVSTKEAFIEFPIGQVSTVSASGGLWGGTLTITAADRTEAVKMGYKDAEKVASAFREAKDAGDRQAAPVTGGSAADELAKYHSLLQSGAISQEEFEQKKTELL